MEFAQGERMACDLGDSIRGVNGGDSRGALRLVWSNCVASLASIARDRRNRRHNAKAESPQALFDGLDGTVVKVSNQEWHVEVFSVLMEPGSTWLQVFLNGETSYTMTLKVPAHERVEHVISIISSWLANPAESSHILASLDAAPLVSGRPRVRRGTRGF